MMEVLKGMAKITAYRERALALECWNLLHEGELTKLAEDYFDADTCDVYFNTSSGNVFLSDEDFNTVMVNDGKLDLWINLSYNGDEGFFDELVERFDELHEEDKEQLLSYASEEVKAKLEKKK